MKQHLLVIILAYSFVGCAANEANVADGKCTSDAQCGGGICNTHLGICLPAASRAPALEVWPPSQNNQGWVVQEFPEVKLDAKGEVLLPLQTGVTVQGLVYANEPLPGTDQTTKRPVAARIVAYRDSLIPNRPKVQFETSQVLTRQDSAAQGYVLWVNRGHTYTFYVAPKEPDDALYPPLIKTIKIDNHTPLDFALEGKDQAVTVTGVIRIGMPPGQALPAGLKVRVRAYRPGGLEQSTVSETDDTGRFTFRVPAGVLGYTIRVESAGGETAKPIPAMECRGRVLGLVSPELQAQDLGTLLLPSFSPPETFTVVVKSTAGDPVANASVTFTHELDVPPSQNLGYEGCSATYTQSGMTDAEGKLDLPLLAASNGQNRNYSVTVVSPPTSGSASQYIPTLEVGSPGVLKAIELDPRYRIAGNVVCAAGNPVAGAAIEAQAIAAGGSEAGLPPSAATATSAKDGRFELFMDPGSYNLDVRPMDGSGLPSLLIKSLAINSGAQGMALRLPEAQALRGQVVAAGGQSATEVANAQVNVYEPVADSDAPLTLRADLRARSVTDGTGLFYLLLPR